ncbi:DNA repair protein RecO [Ruania halotolerans]|uniref:DNA repair protein RecO n=1 Tax=Ruania halotolerans TaxID=2897773 RepID=UPI001E2DEF7E|nr:DNA repair protein RecO [Ruania halotolerans]UFU04920.1 DNA repair protein RecO [Ruania halotolerans]
MKLYRDEAIVLRTHKLGEADRIVTLLTRMRGQVRAVAKGVRRTSSKFGARLEPFAVVDVQLYSGRNLDVVTQVDTMAPHGRALGADYGLYTTATAMVETAERLTEVPGEPATQQYLLLSGALRALAEQRHPATLVLDSYLLRALAVAGWAPSFAECARCADPGPHRAFSAPAGGAVCGKCRPPGAAAPAAETFTLLSALLTGEWPVAEASAQKYRREASGLVAVYTQWHLERQLRSLRLVERA